MVPTADNRKTVALTVRIPLPMADEVAAIAAKSGISQADVCRLALSHYLKTRTPSSAPKEA